MTTPEQRVSDERLAQIHAERPHLVIQDDEYQRLAMDLTDCRAALRAAEQERDAIRRVLDSSAASVYCRERDAALASVAALRDAGGDVMGAFPEIAGSVAGLHFAATLADTAAAQAFVERIRREERERCAKVLEDTTWPNRTVIAAAIRALDAEGLAPKVET